MVFDIHKDTLYTLSKKDPRRLSAQTALYQALQVLVRLAAPVLAFTCEEAWSHMPASWKDGHSSVHHASWPKADPAWGDAELEEEFGLLFNVVRPVVTKQLEDARAAKVIGHPYDAEVTLAVHSKKLFKLLQKHEKSLAPLFVVSRVVLEPAAPQDGAALSAGEVKVEASKAEKCQRCWRRPGDVGKNKEHAGLCSRCVEAIK
jgi:isoleucyl-tRNA synthetase